MFERLEARGAFFRSFTDPIDMSAPQGKFTFQVLGAAAEFEPPIRKRFKAGLANARTKGRIYGNSRLRTRDPAVLPKVPLAQQYGYAERLNETAQDWPSARRPSRP